ncbi:MAG: adenylyltransferase/cytidyltransferase family protein, partial [Planctomycetes bacterium]|nr:adenylyltransferase/cytidyltransferase family protein [Planctomycetota bacterium]
MSTDFRSKILDRDRLIEAVTKARAEGLTVVQCHGCFDIVHPGHIRYLEFAKSQGDLLLVTLTGDPEIQKGQQRPYIPQELRAENLAALMPVDFVHVDPSPTAVDILGAVRPDAYVKGREYEHSRDPGFLAEQRAVESYGGRIIFSSGEIVFSSSRLITQMPRSRELENHRLHLFCRRQEIQRGVVRDLLEKMSGLNVLIVGDVVIDRYVFCDALGVASESPMMSLSQLDEEEYIGGAAIVARPLDALAVRGKEDAIR